LMEFNTVFAKMIREVVGIELQPGMPVLKFIEPAKHTHLGVVYNRVLNGEVCTDIETFRGPGGGDVVMETSYNPIFDAAKKIIGITIFSRDVTERAKGDQKIKNTLKEKELLLSEIHHRIKNNLAMVSSLLQLQEMNINNAEAKEVLAMSRKRIKSTALIHELLYKSESFQNVNLKDYLAELFQHININENIQLKFTGDEPKLSLNNAMPFALLLNEIMLNSFKHSYTDKNKGNIEIIAQVEKGKFRMIYKDFAGNFPDNIDFKNSSTTGLTLIHAFAEQLEGKVELYSKNPPEYIIEIPLNENQ
jgi:two-component sensor histidine kinase